MVLANAAWLRPPNCDAKACDDTVVVLAPGTPFRAAASRLEAAGVIRSAIGFEVLAALRGERGALRSGEYLFTPSQSAGQVLAALVAGDVRQHNATLIEGWTLAQALSYLQGFDALDFDIASANDPRLLRLLSDSIGDLGMPYGGGSSGGSSGGSADASAANFTPADLVSTLAEYGVEGLFAPDTYRFERGAKASEILLRAHSLTLQTLAQEWNQRSERSVAGTPYEALILGSIIEKEAGIDTERARISGVFANRLRRGMRLQSDPTTIYGLGVDYTGALTRAQLDAQTPYNTYRVNGLPPTPISLVGVASLQAALQPESHDFHYFVADGSGGHVFSETLEQHNAAVARYRQLEQERAATRLEASAPGGLEHNRAQQDYQESQALRELREQRESRGQQ